MDDKLVRAKIHTAVQQHCATSGVQPNPCLAQRVLSAAQEGRKETMLQKNKLILLIALAVILLSSTIALAYNHSYVLQYLFGKRGDAGETQELEAQVQPIEYAYENGNIACTVKDAFFDGQNLAIGVGFRTDRPLYMIGEDPKFNGEWIDFNEAASTMDARFLGGVTSPQRFPVMEEITGMRYVLNRPLPKDEEVEVSLKITLLTPINGVEKVDTEQEDHPAMWAAIDAAREKGLTPISCVDVPGQVLISNAQHGYCDPESAYNGPYCNVEALVEYANMEVLDTVKLEFTLVAQ